MSHIFLIGQRKMSLSGYGNQQLEANRQVQKHSDALKIFHQGYKIMAKAQLQKY